MQAETLNKERVIDFLSSKNFIVREEAMRMRLKNGRWYTNFFHQGRKIEVSLEAYEQESRKAQINLGKVLRDLENGINPGFSRKKIKGLSFKGKINDRNRSILDKHIYPFFGGYLPREVTEDLLEKYLKYRWGLDSDGQVQAVTSTLNKELGVLKILLRTVDRKYDLPKIKYFSIKKELLPPLTFPEIEKVSKFIPSQYSHIFWIMVYTAMDISDVVSLKPVDFKDGWIIKESGRGKTRVKIAVPVCSALADILKGVPWPIDRNASLFFDINPKRVSKAVSRAFDKADMIGYGCKYLRRFVASALLDAGYSMDWIGRALAHADGSKITQKYTKVYRSTLEEAFGTINSLRKRQ